MENTIEFENDLLEKIDLELAIQRLTERQQLIIRKIYFENLTEKEVSKLVDRSITTVRKEIKKSIRRLRFFMNKVVVESDIIDLINIYQEELEDFSFRNSQDYEIKVLKRMDMGQLNDILDALLEDVERCRSVRKYERRCMFSLGRIIRRSRKQNKYFNLREMGFSGWNYVSKVTKPVRFF